MARRSMSDLMASAPDIDPEKLDATTEDDIRRYKAAEGYSADYRPTGPVLTVDAPAEIRARLNMTQEAFARALRIPVATLRNWEQGRKLPDPAARSLLSAVARDSEAVLRALDPSRPVASNRKASLPSDYVALPVRLPRTKRAVMRIMHAEQVFTKVRALAVIPSDVPLPAPAGFSLGEITFPPDLLSPDDHVINKPH
jgi:putative transcriptional regulator